MTRITTDFQPRTRFTALLLLTITIMTAGACRSTRLPTEQSIPLVVEVSGANDLNGGGNAAFVHVFQLTDNAGFRTTQAESFWQAPEQVLGDALRGANQVQLFPGANERLDLELNPDARFVGVAANLRDPDRDRWRAVLPASEVQGRILRVVVDANSLSVQVQD